MMTAFVEIIFDNSDNRLPVRNKIVLLLIALVWQEGSEHSKNHWYEKGWV